MTQIEIKNIEQLLKPILNNCKILNCISKQMIPPGENYGGVILSVDVKFLENNLEKTLHFVAKLCPPNEMLCQMFNIQYTFKRELIMYIDIIPTLINFQKEYKIEENKILDVFPKCYGGRLNLVSNSDVLDDDGVILFENLKLHNYFMGNRMHGFNLEQSKLIIKNLARFHAIPIALKILKPDLHKEKISSLKPSNFGDSYTAEMKKEFIDYLYDIILSINDCSKYADKIKDVVDKNFKFEERFLEAKTIYSTIVHHDLWTNNAMIKNNNLNKAEKIKIYDLQMCSYGSLAHDLIFFLFTSVDENAFGENFEYLIQLYFDSFVSCLKEFNINTDLFSWNSFQNELNFIGPYQISHIIIMLRPIFMEKNTVENMDKMLDKDMAQLHALNKQYKVKLRNNILTFAKYNWL